MAKIVLRLEIEGAADVIGEKETIAAALERFGRVQVLAVEQPRQMRMDAWKNREQQK